MHKIIGTVHAVRRSLIGAHVARHEQTVPSLSTDNMALSSGIYTIENVKYRNWAMLPNANEGEVVKLG
jgi:hypothetical protein